MVYFYPKVLFFDRVFVSIINDYFFEYLFFNEYNEHSIDVMINPVYIVILQIEYTSYHYLLIMTYL